MRDLSEKRKNRFRTNCVVLNTQPQNITRWQDGHTFMTLPVNRINETLILYSACKLIRFNHNFVAGKIRSIVFKLRIFLVISMPFSVGTINHFFPGIFLSAFVFFIFPLAIVRWVCHMRAVINVHITRDSVTASAGQWAATRGKNV